MSLELAAQRIGGRSGLALDVPTLLADASPMLDASLDPAMITDTLQRLIVPRLAECCLVDLLGVVGDEARVSSGYAAPSVQQAVPVLTNTTSLASLLPALTADVIRDGVACIISDATTCEGAGEDRSPALLAAVRTLRVRSLIIVPLIARGHTLGAVAVGNLSGVHRYGPQDAALFADLSHRAAIALDHAALFRRAMRANAAREALLTVVSHDLQAPLGAIAMSTTALRATTTDETAHAISHTIDEAVEWMHRLIRDLLDVSSIEAGRLSVIPRQTDLLIMLVKGITMFEAEAKIRHITLSLEAPDFLPTVWADGERILQVVVNLLSNAMKFTREGGCVTVRVAEVPRGVRVEVSDTGPGIPVDLQPFVFDRFSRSHPASGVRGTGLGLAIAQSIMTAHGTRLDLQSVPGVGSTFGFRLDTAVK